jgi:hypothetical protein
VTRDGNTATSDKDITVNGPNGTTKDLQWDRTSTKDGNTVSTTGTLTNTDTGKAVGTYTGSTSKDGDTLTHQDTVANGAGQTVRTDSGTLTRDGNTVTGDSKTTFANGATVNRQGTATHDGNTVSRSGSTTATPGARRRWNYGDEYDLFGDRPARGRGRKE